MSRFHPHIHLRTPSPLSRKQLRPYQQRSGTPITGAAPPCPPAASRRRSWALPYRPFPSLPSESPASAPSLPAAATGSPSPVRHRPTGLTALTLRPLSLSSDRLMSAVTGELHRLPRSPLAYSHSLSRLLPLPLPRMVCSPRLLPCIVVLSSFLPPISPRLHLFSMTSPANNTHFSPATTPPNAHLLSK